VCADACGCDVLRAARTAVAGGPDVMAAIDDIYLRRMTIATLGFDARPTDITVPAQVFSSSYNYVPYGHNIWMRNLQDHQPVLDGVLHELGERVQAQRLSDLVAMKFDGPRRDAQRFGDLLIALSPRREL
jgi:hypothetical protein